MSDDKLTQLSQSNSGIKWYHVHAVHSVLVLLMYLLFRSNLYSDDIYMPWQGIVGVVAVLMISFGWIPIFHSRANLSMREYPYFIMLALLMRRISGRKCKPRFGTYWKHKLIRYRWMLIFIKAYYLPLCTSGIYYGLVRSIMAYDFLSNAFSIAVLILSVEVYVMFISSIVATCGYSIENKKIGFPIKAVETNIFGILFCIVCYSPLNELLPGKVISGKFFEVFRIFESGSWLDLFCSGMMVLFMTIHVVGIVTQGLRFANLTYRGTVTRGLYAYVRHPQYCTKILWFFFAWLPFFGSFRNMICYLGWVALYLGRTITEEHFLKQFPDYNDYCNKVKWRYIPGLW